MKSYRKELWFETPGRRAFLNITPQVEAALEESAVRDGLVLVNAMHITASVFINDDERGLHADYENWLEKLAPHEPVSAYRHNRTGEDNADVHHGVQRQRPRVPDGSDRAKIADEINPVAVSAALGEGHDRLAHEKLQAANPETGAPESS
jgi:thiamine phosphate synthase YjbQ (UPF0047 family)